MLEKNRPLGFLAAFSVALATLMALPGTSQADESLRPVVFVHGHSGSATQFESHAMRFTSNGFPPALLHAFEYDTGQSGEEHQQRILAALDELIDDLLTAHETEQVDLVGHSRGTRVSLDYIGDETRAAKVANYVNLDGSAGRATVEGVRTLAIWGEPFMEADDGRVEIEGSEREVRFAEQAHTEVATSAETFAEMYEWFRGEAPATTDVVPEEEVTIAGRATVFPQNLGVEGATVALHAIDADTGQRMSETPLSSTVLPADGAWGPFEVDPGASYELVLSREDTELIHHFYPEPFERSNHFVRLQTSNPGEGAALLIEDDPAHTTLVITRNMEWWGDQGEASDALEIDGRNIVNEGTSPREDRNIAVFAFDAGADGESEIGTKLPIFTLPQTTFLTGVDIHIAASPDAGGTVEIANSPRGSERTAIINVPNWPSDAHRVSVMFRDDL